VLTGRTLSGWRRSCVFRMRWEDLNLQDGMYDIPKQAVGWKGLTGTVALGDYTVDLLTEGIHGRQALAY